MRGLVVSLSCSLCLWAALASRSLAADAADRWEAAIRKFEEADRKSPPAPGQVVFIGSSSIRLWKLAESFPDVPALRMDRLRGSLDGIGRDPSCVLKCPTALGGPFGQVCGREHDPTQ